jgi:hypothetical protein
MKSVQLFRAWRAVVPVVVLALSSVASAATVAQAAPVRAAAPAATSQSAVTGTSAGPETPRDKSCAGGDLCFWVDTNKDGAKGRVAGDNLAWNWGQPACGDGTWNNCASSIQNNGNYCTVWVFADAGHGGSNLELTRGTYLSDLTGYWIRWPFRNWNDEIQSNKWCNL